MLYFHLSRDFSEQNFDFFSLNNVTGNLPIETGHKIIQGAEFQIPLPRSCNLGKMNYCLLPNLMPEMCVGQEIRVTCGVAYCRMSDNQSTEPMLPCKGPLECYWWRTKSEVLPWEPALSECKF